MFSKHDPRAEALRAVHENRVTVDGTAYDSRPEFLIDHDPAWGVLNELLDDGYISYDESAPLPAAVETTDKGKLALTALFGIIPVAPAAAPVTPTPAPILPGPNVSGSDDSDGRSGSEAHQVLDAEDNTGRPLEPAPDAVTINYFGLGPQCLDFANGKDFRDAVSKHGYDLHFDDHSGQNIVLATGQPVTGSGYLSVIDPASDAHLFVLYDDESWSDLESPGFVEILTLMDDYCKASSKSRLFMAEPETDEEEDELDLWVGEDHPFYGLEFDFTTGKYTRS